MQKNLHSFFERSPPQRGNESNPPNRNNHVNQAPYAQAQDNLRLPIHTRNL